MKLPLAIGVVLLVATEVGAQAHGPWELELAAAAVNGTSFNGFNAAGDASIGYFLSDRFEVSFRQSIQYSDLSLNGAYLGLSRIAADFYRPFGDDNRLAPFVGVNGGYLWGNSVRQSAEAAPEAGLKWFLNRDTFLFVMFEYRIFFNAEGGSSNTLSNADFVYTVGVGFRF